MNQQLLEKLHAAGPLLTLAVVILVGMSFGALARRVRLPGITGQILAGVLIGTGGLDLFGEEPLIALQPLTHFALGLMAVTVGGHLSLKRLRNAGKRLFYLLLTESTVTPVVVFLALWGIGRTSVSTAVLLATVSIATAPATIVALVKESRAKGVFVKTLVAAVALNNMACLFLFEVARAFVRPATDGSLHEVLGEPALQLLVAIGIGGGIALVVEGVSRFVVRTDILATVAIVALVLASGMASLLEVSPLIACLFLGVVQTNISRAREKLVDAIFADFQPAILAVFFTLAGMHLSLEIAVAAGGLAVLQFFARAGGKWVAADLAMRWAHATERVRKNLGLALVPQAGVAVALVILIQDDPAFANVQEIFSAVVLTVVTANEIVGPILTRLALARAGEAGKDRGRLMDFLQEEHIVTDFRANDKRQAIERLVDLMLRTHHLKGVDRSTLLESVLQREAQASTCLGGGLSVPHGILPDGQPMAGVMAISRDGLDLPTPDDRLVHCMVLLGTSTTERDRHLQVLAALARTVGTDPAFQALLFNAKNAAHASELLHGEESEDFNYFLDDDS